MTSEQRHQLEDEALRLVIRRMARDWPPCCRSWLTARVCGDLRGPVVRNLTDGRVLCPHCRRRLAAPRRKVAA